MCSSTPLPPRPVSEVSIDPYMVKYYGIPATKAMASASRFVLVDCNGETVVVVGLTPDQVSSLVRAWRQGMFEGSTGKDLAELIEIYSS